MPAPSSGEGSLIGPRAGPEEKEEKGAPQLRRQRRPPKSVSSRTPLPNRVRTPRRLRPLPQRLAPALRRPPRGSGHPHGGLRGRSVEAGCASGAATGGRRTLRSAEHAQRTVGGARGQGRSREHAAIGDCVSLASPGPQLRPPETRGIPVPLGSGRAGAAVAACARRPARSEPPSEPRLRSDCADQRQKEKNKFLLLN